MTMILHASVPMFWKTRKSWCFWNPWHVSHCRCYFINANWAFLVFGTLDNKFSSNESGTFPRKSAPNKIIFHSCRETWDILVIGILFVGNRKCCFNLLRRTTNPSRKITGNHGKGGGVLPKEKFHSRSFKLQQMPQF